MKNTCHKTACPFAYTDLSEQAQNYGCLPTPANFFEVFNATGQVISCHEDKAKKCVGFLIFAKESGVRIPPKAPIIHNFGGTNPDMQQWEDPRLTNCLSE